MSSRPVLNPKFGPLEQRIRNVGPFDPGATGFRFIDLFAGIGGFHAALTSLGGECVYAVENDAEAAKVYELNWGLDPLGDVELDTCDPDQIPDHEVLAAGFPCQPFSKSGAQRGMEEARGTLFWFIARIIEAKRPAVVLLENVRNLAGPRHRHEWEVIVNTLRGLGYRVSDQPAVFSPHLLPREAGGRPQARERVFITATRVEQANASLEAVPVARPKPTGGWDPQSWDLARDLPLEANEQVEGCDLSDDEVLWIDAWDDFVRRMRIELNGGRLPGFPIWADSWVVEDELNIPLDTASWKATFLRKNSAFYTRHQKTLDKWTAEWGIYTDRFPTSRRKFEWQAQDAQTLWECVMHMRPSGIRAKRATYVPALVAITQTSIVGPRRRRLSPREAAHLQGFNDDFTFGEQSRAATYRQLGNAVNIGVVRHILKKHVERDRSILTTTAPALVNAVHSSAVEVDMPPSRPGLEQHGGRQPVDFSQVVQGGTRVLQSVSHVAGHLTKAAAQWFGLAV